MIAPKTLWTVPVVLALALAAPALAQDDIFPSQALPQAIAAAPEFELSPEDATHPMIRLTPDKSEIVRLDAEARSIIVGNPVHLNVLMDNTTTLILSPQAPGATHFTVLDQNGRIIMQRHVIVASPKERYVRIRRSCANAGGGGCAQTSVYFCPDMCHEIAVPVAGGAPAGGLMGALLGGGGATNSIAAGAMAGGAEQLMNQLGQSFEQSAGTAGAATGGGSGGNNGQSQNNGADND